MRRTYKLFVFLLLCSNTLLAQIGGEHILSYQEMILPARISAGGGAMISHHGADPSLSLVNPSLLTESMDGQVFVNSVFHYSGIAQGTAAYIWKPDSIDWTMSVGSGFTHYGTFTGKDVNNLAIPNFVAQDVMAYFAAGRQEGDYSYGVRVKFAHSQYEIYNSLAILADFGATWHNEEKKISAGILMKNVGTQIATFTPSDNEPLPFDIQIGITKQLEHLPFRFSIQAHHLQSWEIRYPNETTNTTLFADDSTAKEKKYVGDNILRHLSVGGEFLLHKNFHLMFGYNHLKRREMAISTRRGLAGFSMGVDVKVKKLRLTYGRSWYFINGASNQLSLSMNISKLMHKKVVQGE